MPKSRNRRKKQKNKTKKGRGIGKYAGLKVIEWVDKHVNAMATVKLSANSTPFMKEFQTQFKKMNKEEENIFKKRKGALFIHHTFLLHELYHRIMTTFKFTKERKQYPLIPSPTILKKLKNIVNKCSNMGLASIRAYKSAKRQGGPSIEVMTGGGMKGGALLTAVTAYLAAHAKLAAGIGGTYAFVKLCMKKYAAYETAETIKEKVEKATTSAMRSARAELMKPGFDFTEEEINRELTGLERALRLDYAKQKIACSEMGGELYTHINDGGETKESCMCDLKSARRAAAAGSSSNQCERLIEEAMSRHEQISGRRSSTAATLDAPPEPINLENVQNALPPGSSRALVIPRNDVRRSMTSYDQLRMSNPNLFNNLQVAIREARERGDNQIRLSDGLSRQLIDAQSTVEIGSNEPQNWEDWSIEIRIDPDAFASYDPRTILQMYQNLEESMYNIQGLINQAVIREIQLRGSNIGDVASGGNTLGFFERLNPFSSARARRRAMMAARDAYNREREGVLDLARNRMEGVRLIRSNLRRAWENILSIANIASEQLAEYDADIQFGVGVAALAYLEPRLLGSLLAREWMPFLQGPMAQQPMINLPPPLHSGSFQMPPTQQSGFPTLQDMPSGMGRKQKKKKKRTRKNGRSRGFRVTRSRTSYSVF